MPSIDQIGPMPYRNSPTFSDDAQNLFRQLPPLISQINALTTEYSENAAILAANTPSVLASANFKGLWSGLSGALNVPAMVYHLGAYWVLAANVANVASEVPGTSLSWLLPPTGNNIYNVNHGII